MLIELERTLSEQEVRAIEMFQYRFQELWSNIQSLKALGVNFNGGVTFNFDSDSISGPKLDICKHRLKGLFMDFRFFIANDEPTNVYKFIKNIGKFSSDQTFRDCLKDAKDSWKHEGYLFGWLDYKANDLITIYFNSEAFHGELKHEDDYAKLMSFFEKDQFLYILTDYIFERSCVIRNINYLIKHMVSEHKIQLP